jgi:hypothetical protein
MPACSPASDFKVLKTDTREASSRAQPAAAAAHTASGGDVLISSVAKPQGDVSNCLQSHLVKSTQVAHGSPLTRVLLYINKQ